jgi:hypothetical protein
MKKMLLRITILVIVTAVFGCATQTGITKADYDLLKTAVTTTSYAVIGKYGDTIPEDLTSQEFLQIAKDETPVQYFNELKKFDLEIKPKGSYYLLKVYDPDTKKLILYDYSCTPFSDGNILDEPQQTTQPEDNDPCKSGNW